ncbi:WD40-repeat-containing domain protein, partial [Trametes punicea]
MARGLSTLLSSTEPCTVAPGNVTIGHVQLRDVLICPHEKGIVAYPRNFSIVEHDILNPHSSPRRLVDLTFTPNTISSLILPDTNDTLLAAGGQEAELHLSYYQSTDSCSSPSTSSTRSIRSAPHGFGRKLWESKYILEHAASINNSVMLTSMSFSRSNESAAEPRILVSNNDRTVKFYDIAVRSGRVENDYEPRLLDIGNLRLDVPVNHSSISPDGRTLLSVGDSPDVYLHRITGGSKITFTPIAKLSLSAYIQESHVGGLTPVSSIPASFSTAFSADGYKFAVASQEGVVVVWDVRSTKPLKVFHTDKSRATVPSGRGTMSTAPGAWPYELPWDWSRGGTRAPGWGVRSVKFSPPNVGREVMTFTEHTSLLHVVDARTFETEEIVRMPNFDSPAYYSPATTRPRSTSPVSRSATTVR